VDPPAGRDVGRGGIREPGVVRRGEVDLVVDPVQAEGHGFGMGEPSRSSVVTTDTFLAMTPIMRSSLGPAQGDTPPKQGRTVANKLGPGLEQWAIRRSIGGSGARTAAEQ
jgi:hypothetical protein